MGITLKRLLWNKTAEGYKREEKNKKIRNTGREIGDANSFLPKH